MKKELFVLSMAISVLIVGCTKEVANSPKEVVESKENAIIIANKQVEGVVIGFTEDKKHIFLETPEGELSVALAEALEVENGDVLFLEYTVKKNGAIEVLNVKVKSKQSKNEPTDVTVETQEQLDGETEKPISDEIGFKRMSEKAIFYGKADNHSVEIATESGINVYSFPPSMSDMLDTYEYEKEVTITYFKNEDGQLILTAIE